MSAAGTAERIVAMRGVADAWRWLDETPDGSSFDECARLAGGDVLVAEGRRRAALDTPDRRDPHVERDLLRHWPGRPS